MKYVLKDEILDMLLAHKSLPCEDAKRIREKLSTQETWRKAMAGGLLFSRETLDNIPDNELDPSILIGIGDSSVAHDIVMIWTWRRGKSVKVVANKSWLGALQPASQEAAEFLADLIYTKKYDEKVKSVLHTNFDVNALLEREVLKPIWDKLTKKADKTAAATQAESADEGADDAALVKAAIRLSEPNEAKATEAVHAVEALKTEDKIFNAKLGKLLHLPHAQSSSTPEPSTSTVTGKKRKSRGGANAKPKPKKAAKMKAAPKKKSEKDLIAEDEEDEEIEDEEDVEEENLSEDSVGSDD